MKAAFLLLLGCWGVVVNTQASVGHKKRAVLLVSFPTQQGSWDDWLGGREIRDSFKLCNEFSMAALVLGRWAGLNQLRYSENKQAAEEVIVAIGEVFTETAKSCLGLKLDGSPSKL